MIKNQDVSVKDTFKKGFDIYIKNIELFLFVDAVSLVPSFLYQFKNFGNNGGESSALPGLFVFFLSLLNIGAVFTALKKIYEGTETDVWQCIKEGIFLIPRVLATAVINGIIIFAGIILFVLPGLYWALKYIFVIQAAVAEDKNLSPFKISAKLTSDKMLYSFLTVVGAYILVLVPYYIVIYATKGNFWMHMLFGLPVAFFTTAAQAVHYAAYDNLKSLEGKEIKSDDNSLKGLGTASGCLIGAAGFAVIFSVITGISMLAVSKGKIDYFARKIFGGEISIDEKAKINLKKGWFSIPDKKYYDTHVLVKLDNDRDFRFVTLRIVPLDNALVKGIKTTSKQDEIITAIESIERDYMEKTGKIENVLSWDSFDNFEPVKREYFWNKLLLYQSGKEPYKTSVLYYGITEKYLVYFYINTEQTDLKIRGAEKTVEEVLEMIQKKEENKK